MTVFDKLDKVTPKEVRQQKIVTPIISKLNDEKQFNLWIKKETLKKLKMISSANEISIKEIINEAIENHIKSKY